MSSYTKRLKGTLFIDIAKDPKIADLYLAHNDFKEIISRLGTNTITVILRTELEKTGMLK